MSRAMSLVRDNHLLTSLSDGVLTSIAADPDRSNPTRYRLERPLDTIRSFQAAAEGTSNRRSSYTRPSMFDPTAHISDH